MSDLDHNSKVGISTDKLSQRRRALIKGSAVAIPAILTLRSGSALAATSTLLALQKSRQQILLDSCYNCFGLEGDTWLRQSTDCRVLNKQGKYSIQYFET